MTAHLKLAAAEDDIAYNQSLIQHLSAYLELDRVANHSVSKENAKLRSRVVTLQGALEQHQQHSSKLRAQLVSALAALENRDAEIEELQGQFKMEDNHSKAELASLSQRLATVEERAKLAEDTLRHRELLANERAQMQADMQHYSQDLAKMAIQTGNAANVTLQQTMTDMQLELEKERKARVDAESRATLLEKEVSRLEKKVDAKQRRIAGLEEALQRENQTPAGGRDVDDALDAVGAFVNQLGGSPESAMPATRRRPALPSLKVIGASNKKDSDSVDNSGKAKRVPSKTKMAAAYAQHDEPNGKGLAPVAEQGDEELFKERETEIAVVPKRRRASKAVAAPMDEEVQDCSDKHPTTKRQKVAVGKNRVGGEAKENAGVIHAPEAKKDNRPLNSLTSKILVPVSANVAAPTEPLKSVAARSILGPPAPQPAAAAIGKRRLLGVSNSSKILGDALPASKLFGNNFVVPKLHGK